MKLLVDVGVGLLCEQWLRVAGHDVVAIRQFDPAMPDLDILALAVKEQRLVITMDKDFGELVHRSGQRQCGVLLLRLDDADGATKRAAIAAIFTQHAGRLPGKFSVFKAGRLRIRP